MKLLIFTLVYATIAYAEDQCGNEDHFENACQDDQFLAKISCKGEEDPCTCDPEDIINGLTGSILDANKCKEICEEFEDTTKCRYFRWEKDPLSSLHCSLMSEDQCTKYNPCEDPEMCLSGCVTTTPPKVEMCMANVTFSTESEAVHWSCINPYDETNGYINIYNKTEEVPQGTLCETVRRCITFDTDEKDDPSDGEFYRRLVVQCNEEGQWVKFSQSDNDITDAVNEHKPHNTLIDQTCSQLPADLKLDASKLNKDGVSLVCEKQDDDHYFSDETNVIIKQDNLCVVLCGLHHVMTIEPKFDYNEGISKFWKYTIGKDDKGEEATAENIYCSAP